MSTSGEASRGVNGLDSKGLSALLKLRRDENGLSVRQAAESAGVSFMTLSRVESGSQPDLTTFLKLCSWLQVKPERFFLRGARRESDTLEEVASHLATDPRLDPEAASKIASVVSDMYEALASKLEPARPPVACHLRAASILRPGVSDLLGAALGDMHDKLVELDASGAL